MNAIKKITIDNDMHSDGGMICSDSVETTNNTSNFSALANKKM